MAKGSCKTESAQACTYSIEKGLSVVAGSADDKKTLKSLTIHLMTEDATVALKYLLSLATILAVYAPGADEDERGVALKKIIKDITDGDTAKAELHGIVIAVTSAEPFGTLTSVSRK